MVSGTFKESLSERSARLKKSNSPCCCSFVIACTRLWENWTHRSQEMCNVSNGTLTVSKRLLSPRYYLFLCSVARIQTFHISLVELLWLCLSPACWCNGELPHRLLKRSFAVRSLEWDTLTHSHNLICWPEWLPEHHISYTLFFCHAIKKTPTLSPWSIYFFFYEKPFIMKPNIA